MLMWPRCLCLLLYVSSGLINPASARRGWRSRRTHDARRKSGPITGNRAGDSRLHIPGLHRWAVIGSNADLKSFRPMARAPWFPVAIVSSLRVPNRRTQPPPQRPSSSFHRAFCQSKISSSGSIEPVSRTTPTLFSQEPSTCRRAICAVHGHA